MEIFKDNTLLIASGNIHKQKDIASLLVKQSQFFSGVNFIYPSIPAPEETADNFEQIAKEKALYYYRQTGNSCIADDSGLCCDDLDGMPGIFSARWCKRWDYKDGIEKVISLLKEVKKPDLKAKFVCVFGLVTIKEVIVARGEVEGKILLETRGTKGFGYDPIFIPNGETRTFGEMTFEEKAQYSHRQKALENLSAYMKKKYI